MIVNLTDYFPGLRPVPITEIERVYTPAAVHIPDEVRAQVEAVTGPIPVGGSLFTHLGHRTRCPRRYPTRWTAPDAWAGRPGALLLADGPFHTALRQGARETYSIPRVARQQIRAGDGGPLDLVDVRSCYPSILAILAEDVQMLADARERRLVDRLGPDVAALGGARKAMVLALVSGGGPRAIRNLAAEAGGAITIDAAAKVIRGFWSHYPAAHQTMRSWIDDLDRETKGFVIAFGGWKPAQFTADDLRGAWSPDGKWWIESRSPSLAAWTSILRAAESAVMDACMVAWHAVGARCAQPLFDGHLLACSAGGPSGNDLAAIAETVARDMGMPLRIVAS